MKGMRLLIAVMLMPMFAMAQAAAPPGLGGIKLNVGAKLGVNLARLNGNDWDGGYKTNLLGGVYINLHGSRFGLQVEGLFSQSTYTTGPDFKNIYQQYLNSTADSLKQGSFKVSYLSIPLLLQYRFMQRVWIQIGPQYSGIASVKDKEEFAKDAEQLFKSGTISGVAGLWINIGSHLNIGGRYIFSFTDENKTSISDSWKRRDIQVHLGYTF